MPPGKRQQTSTMLYTLIVFVVLFIAATTAAVVFYVKSEEHKKNANDLQRQISDLATSSERTKLGTIVGTKPSGQSWLGAMVDYLDKTVTLIVGGVPESTSAEVKVSEADTKIKNTLPQVREHIDVADINRTGLVQLIKDLKAKLDYIIGEKEALKKQFDELQKRYEDDMAANFEKEQVLLAEKDKYQQQVNEIQQAYKDLEDLLRKNTEEQVQNLFDELKQNRENLKTTNQELLRTQAELREAEDLVKRAQQELRKIKPAPDREVAALKPDGEIILVDDNAKVVHLNIGSDDHIYQGLTFSVYNKNTSVAKDGEGKAEVEVFDIAKNYSAARIISSEINSPVLEGDIVANLIWDSSKINEFVVVGEFDIDEDGDIDYDAVDRIRVLIEKWGGKVADNVSIDTDFVVLGRVPKLLAKPTPEQQELNPGAMERYNESVRELEYYKEVEKRAQSLWIPIFNYERFLYLIGYKSYARTAGAF